MIKNHFLLTFILSLFSFSVTANVVYVDSTHVGGVQDGTSWAAAFSNFQAGINAAHAGDSIWVAKGTYLPAADSFFAMKDSVQIYGGFLNTNTSLAERDFQNNVTTLKGNGYSVIRNVSLTPSMAHVTVLNGFTITGGNAVQGGGMYNEGVSPVIKDCIFINNHAVGSGGGIHNSDASPIITTCQFNNNYTSDPVYFGKGGAISNFGSSPTIGGCSFSGNYSEGGFGGAFFIDDNSIPIILNCTFSANQALYGGAISLSGVNVGVIDIVGCSFTGNGANDTLACGGAIATGGNLRLNSCTFSNNSANYLGGALWNTGDLIMSACILDSNKAHSGGALYNFFDPNNIVLSKVYNCDFHKNSSVDGGAIYNDAYLMVASTVVYKNEADSSGSGIYNSGNCRIINSTWSGNSSANNASVIYNPDPSATKITNSIVWGNYNSALLFYTAGTDYVTHSLVQGIAADNVHHNIDGSQNPNFVDTAADNYQLLPTSVGINVGINDSIPYDNTQDILGNNRIYNITVDLGAYENKYPTLSFLKDTSICSNGAVTLNAQNDSSTYLWNTGAITQTIVVNATGTYFVTVTNALGTATDTFDLIIKPVPVVDLGNDSNLPQNGSITLDAANLGCTYLWNTGATSQTITVNTDGIYSVTVTNTNGCSASDTITVNANPLAIGGVNAAASNITIVPNPAKDNVYINFDNPKLLNTKALLTDIYGRVIKTITISKKSQQVSLAEFASGLYIFKLENGQSVKIVKE